MSTASPRALYTIRGLAHYTMLYSYCFGVKRSETYVWILHVISKYVSGWASSAEKTAYERLTMCSCVYVVCGVVYSMVFDTSFSFVFSELNRSEKKI